MSTIVTFKIDKIWFEMAVVVRDSPLLPYL